MHENLDPIYENIKLIMEGPDFNYPVALPNKKFQNHFQWIILKNISKEYSASKLHYEFGLKNNASEVVLELHFEGEWADWAFERFKNNPRVQIPDEYEFFDNFDITNSKHSDRVRGIRNKQAIPLTKYNTEEIANELVGRLEDLEKAVGSEVRNFFN